MSCREVFGTMPMCWDLTHSFHVWFSKRETKPDVGLLPVAV